MLRFVKLGLLGLTVLSTVAVSSDAFATNATGNASATIVAAITVSETTAMNFANIAPDAAGDTVTLTAAGAISAVDADTSLFGTPAAGVFDATGLASTAVTISFSSGDTLTGPGTAMPIGSFTHNAGGSPAFSGLGALSFNVGAALTVGAAQTVGAYTGTYTVTVDY